MNESASVHWSTGPGVPGTTGTPTFIARRCMQSVSGLYAYGLTSGDELPRVRAFVLSPRLSITSGAGPMKAIPACSTFRANSAFSDKKPYLGRM